MILKDFDLIEKYRNDPNYERFYKDRVECVCSICHKPGSKTRFILKKPITVCPFESRHYDSITDINKTLGRMLE